MWVRRWGFTLIELLIVVAVVAILAALAVPNFREAHVRSKISRVRSDMRTLAMALEAYAADHNDYPQPTGNGIPKYLRQLSTPIAYITNGRLPDPFLDRRGGITHEIEYWGCNDKRTAVGAAAIDGTLREESLGGGQAKISWWFLRSAGPDDDVNAGGASHTTWLDANLLITYLYDPTNGTYSFGDLWRVGGSPASDFDSGARLVIASQ